MKKDIVEIKNVVDFKKIEHRWKIAESGVDMTVFQSYEWNKLLYLEWENYKYNNIGSRIEMFVIENESVTMIFPALVQSYSSRLKAGLGRDAGVYLLGQESYSDYLNIIYNEFSKELFSELLLTIRNRYPGLKIHLFNVREDTNTYNYLIDRYQIVNSTVSVYIDIPKSDSEFNKTLSKHTKQNLRTALNRMNKDDMQYEWHTADCISDKEKLECLSQIHRRRMITKNYDTSSLKRRVVSWINLQPLLYKEQYNNIVQNSMCTMNNSFVEVVELQGNIVGYIYGLKDKEGVIRILQNCIDEKYAFYSPMFRGIYDFIIEHCGSKELRKLDFTRGDEEYKYKLGGKEIKLYDFII